MKSLCPSCNNLQPTYYILTTENGISHTHMSGEEFIHLFLYSALTVWVDGQEVAGEGQRVAAGLITRQEEDESLAHDLILSYHLLLWTHCVRVLLVSAVVPVGGRRLCLLVPVIDFTGRVCRVKVFQ